MADEQYDFIIAGAGCAGLSLLYRILLDTQLQQKSILVIDKQPKDKNDRTWCYWEQDEGVFEPVVIRSWDKIAVYSESTATVSNIHPYRYKMITGIDFYRHVMHLASQFPNVIFRYEKILGMKVVRHQAIVITANSTFRATRIFNSTSLYSTSGRNEPHLHFKGLRIHTENDSFDPTLPVLMDFRVPQQDGSAFMYMLPLSKREALVEYTYFGNKYVMHANFAEMLKNYIINVLNLTQFEITGDEEGVLPLMCGCIPDHHRERIIHIGAAAGCVKPGSGYAFQFIQRHSESIVQLQLMLTVQALQQLMHSTSIATNIADRKSVV